MMDYFITCAAISICVWFASILLKNAPARISFYLLMFALLSWFVPWQLVPEAVTAKVPIDAWFDLAPIDLQSPVLSMPSANTAGQAGTASMLWSLQFSWAHLFGALLMVGVTVFLWRLYQYSAAIKSLNIKAIAGVFPASFTQAYPEIGRASCRERV